MIMPFGKHKGREVADLPRTYLEWLLTKVELRPETRAAVESALARFRPQASVPSQNEHDRLRQRYDRLQRGVRKWVMKVRASGKAELADELLDEIEAA